VDMQTYSHSQFQLLAIQIDAAINSGNSGGPAFKDKKVCGVAFETLTEAENIGYIIPVLVIQHFLREVQTQKKYRGFCFLGFEFQELENTDLRDFLKMKPEDTGILINFVDKCGSAAGRLKEFDVLLKFDGVQIADDGSVLVRQDERLSFTYFYLSKYVGDKAVLTILREGNTMEVEVIMEPLSLLVPINLYDRLPSYYIHAGFVFVPLTRPYLRNEYGDKWQKKAPVKLVDFANYGQKEFPDQEIVILSQTLAAETNIGYQELQNIRVIAVNNIALRNLKHLRQLVENNKEKYLRFDLDFKKVVILDTSEAAQSNNKILKQHNIPAKMSDDLL